MQTKTYREQHGRLRQILNDLKTGDRQNAPESEMRSHLARLSGLVKIHLTNEDEGLYPRLFAHQNDAVRKKAAQFQQTMGSLAKAFTDFYGKWTKGNAISADRAGFSKELAAVLGALSARMDLEDRELYALADRELATA